MSCVECVAVQANWGRTGFVRIDDADVAVCGCDRHVGILLERLGLLTAHGGTQELHGEIPDVRKVRSVVHDLSRALTPSAILGPAAREVLVRRADQLLEDLSADPGEVPGAEALAAARLAWADTVRAPGVLVAHIHDCPRAKRGTSRTTSADCTCWYGRIEAALGL